MYSVGMPPTVSSPPGRPRGTLDLSAIVRTALDLLDTDGPGAMSVRAVARRLGVAPNALYTYVPHRAALERAVVEQVLSEVQTGLLSDESLDWRRRTLGYARDLRAVLLRHPGAAGLFMTAPMDGPTAIEVGELLMVALVEGGLADDDAACGTYLLIVHVLGSVALEVAETDGRPPLMPEADRVRERRAALEHIDPHAWPRTAAAVPVMAGWISSRQFDWGLDCLLDGMQHPRQGGWHQGG